MTSPCRILAVTAPSALEGQTDTAAVRQASNTEANLQMLCQK